jgi:hypothetical protein
LVQRRCSLQAFDDAGPQVTTPRRIDVDKALAVQARETSPRVQRGKTVVEGECLISRCGKAHGCANAVPRRSTPRYFVRRPVAVNVALSIDAHRRGCP